MEAQEPVGIEEMFEQLAAQGQEQAAPAVSEADETVVPDVTVAEGDDSVKPPDEPEAPSIQQNQARDEHGRFLPKEELAPEDVPVEPVVEGEPEPEVEWENVSIPGAEGESFEIEAPAELAAQINALAEQAAQSQTASKDVADARAQMVEAESRQAELDEIQGYIEADPVGYLTSRVRPELRQQVVMDLLLSSDEIYEAVSVELEKWQMEPHERRIQSAERRATRVEQERDFTVQREARKATQLRASEIMGQLHEFVPTDMPAETARRFFDDMYRDLTEHGQRNGWSGVSPAALPEILSYRFNQYGVDPKISQNGAPRDETGMVVARPANAAAEAIAAKAETARGTGEKLRLQYQRRRAAGASAPSGVGTPANRARPPKGATLDQALDWAKQNLGSG